MLTRQDCYKMLLDIKAKGINIEEQLKEVVKSPTVPKNVIRFISENTDLKILQFYEVLRKQNNKKNSKLYINIMKGLEDPTELLITLSSLITRIFIFSKTLDNSEKKMFFENVNLQKIINAQQSYLINYDISECVECLNAIKRDIKLLEDK